MSRREQRRTFENQMMESGLVQVRDEDLPRDWKQMSNKEQVSWLAAFARGEVRS